MSSRDPRPGNQRYPAEEPGGPSRITQARELLARTAELPDGRHELLAILREYRAELHRLISHLGASADGSA
ncbi:MAG: hypothetical protein ACR2FU_01775 [Streptosporangiaceae bacterium]